MKEIILFVESLNRVRNNNNNDGHTHNPALGVPCIVGVIDNHKLDPNSREK